MHPIDETPPERKERRDSRAREKGAARQRRYWKRQKSDDANLVNGRNASNKRIGIVTQDARIVAAIQNGATRKPEISAVTGLPDTTIGPLLTKLIKAGAIERVGHGLYRAPEVARASAQPTDHVAEGNVPESEAKGACATMPASLVLEEEEPLEPSGAWRKPRTPSPAEWARMQWAADGRVA
jgi:hypothetical protein